MMGLRKGSRIFIRDLIRRISSDAEFKWIIIGGKKKGKILREKQIFYIQRIEK